jgi:gliding motility-associated lipoprotein GldH
MNRILVVTILIALIFSGCKKQEELMQLRTFENHTWERFDFVRFEFPVTDIKQFWNIYIVIRYDDDFKERMLPVNVEMITPSEVSRTKDYNLILRSINNNEITGELKDGYYEMKTLTHPQFQFSETGICSFEIENLNSKFFTAGVQEIGILMEPAD